MILEPRCLAFCSAWVRRCAKLLKTSISLSRAELSKSLVFRSKEPSSKARRCHDLLTNYRFCLWQALWQTAGRLFGRQGNYALKKLIALQQLRTMGAQVAELNDGLEISGPAPLHGAHVASFGDHRIAMAFAIAGLFAEGETVVQDAECIRESYPGFGTVLDEFTNLKRMQISTPVIGSLTPTPVEEA